MFGLLALGLGGLPLLGGGLVFVQVASNAQQQVPNPEFAELAWHNLGTEEIFPEGFGHGTGRMEEHQGVDTWARQGIAEEAACEEVLTPEFMDSLVDNGCQRVFRATYVDSFEGVAATVSLVVLENGESLGEVLDALPYFREEAGDYGPLVAAHPVPGTPAEGFDDDAVGGDDLTRLTFDTDDAPYLVATVAGPIDGRAVDGLPGPWSGSESEEEIYSGTARFVGQEFEYAFTDLMRGT